MYQHSLLLSRSNIDKWLKRWSSSVLERQKWLSSYESSEISWRKYSDCLLSLLRDKSRSGRQSIFSETQIEQIVGLAATDPSSLDLPFTNWSHSLLRLEAIKRNIVNSISVSQVGRFLKKT